MRPRQGDNLAVFHVGSVDGEAHECALLLPSLQSCSTGVDVEQIELRVIFYFKDV